MKLLLTSKGITNPSIAKALGELLGKPFKKSRVAYIPTAGYSEPGDKGWIEEEMDTLHKLGFLSFDVVDISKVAKDIWLPLFEKADVLAFGGGSVEYLLGWLEKSGVKDVLPDLLKTRVYAGFSAGSMVTVKHVSLSKTSMLYYEQTGKLQNAEGLGFVDFEIRPHLNSPSFPNVRPKYLENLAKENPTPFYALDDNSAVKVDGDNISVVSEGEWKKYN